MKFLFAALLLLFLAAGAAAAGHSLSPVSRSASECPFLRALLEHKERRLACLAREAPTATTQCQALATAIANRDVLAALKMASPALYLHYANTAMPNGGRFFGRRGLATYLHRTFATCDTTNRTVEVLGADDARDTCVLRLTTSGTFRGSGNAFTNLNHYIAVRFALGKAKRIRINDGSYDAMMAAFRTRGEQLAYNFVTTLHREGPDSDAVKALIAPEARFRFLTMPSCPVKLSFRGHSGFLEAINHFIDFAAVNNIRSLQTLPLPLFANRAKECRTVLSDNNSVTGVCRVSNVASDNQVFKRLDFFGRLQFDENGLLTNYLVGALQPVYPPELHSAVRSYALRRIHSVHGLRSFWRHATGQHRHARVIFLDRDQERNFGHWQNLELGGFSKPQRAHLIRYFIERRRPSCERRFFQSSFPQALNLEPYRFRAPGCRFRFRRFLRNLRRHLHGHFYHRRSFPLQEQHLRMQEFEPMPMKEYHGFRRDFHECPIRARFLHNLQCARHHLRARLHELRHFLHREHCQHRQLHLHPRKHHEQRVAKAKLVVKGEVTCAKKVIEPACAKKVIEPACKGKNIIKITPLPAQQTPPAPAQVVPQAQRA